MIEGITFDGTPNPLILDKWTWTMSRVSLQNASVISSVGVTPTPHDYSAALTYDPTTSHFYAVGEDQYLFLISGGTSAPVQFGSGIGEFFNFNGMSVDPSGNLWLVTDNDGNTLWEIDKQTGVGTPKTHINLPAGSQVTALAIDGSDHFIVYANQFYFGVPTYFWQVDPNTGSTTELSYAFANNSPTVPPEILAMAYDPVSEGVYGVERDVYANTSVSYELVRITDVPEPGAIGLLLASVLMELQVCRSYKSTSMARTC